MQCLQTKRYSSFDVVRSELSNDVQFVIHLQVNCAYSLAIIEAAIKRRPWCVIQGAKTKTINDLKIAQIGDFENIDWESVINGSHIASSYLVRKGLSRKAQLAMQIRRYLSKHRDSILLKATPFTLILETWNAFEDMRVDFGHGTFASFDSNLIINVALRQRLEWCLEDIKLAMEDTECDHWILKSSVTNKGADIVIIRNWENLLDAIENVPDIREWVLQKYVFLYPPRLSIFMSVWVSVYLSVYLSFSLSFFLPFILFFFLSIFLSSFISLHTPISSHHKRP